MKIFGGYEFFKSRPKPSNRYSRIEKENTQCRKCGNWTRTLVMKNPDQRLCITCFASK